jgi:hypothetical protein
MHPFRRPDHRPFLHRQCFQEMITYCASVFRLPCDRSDVFKMLRSEHTCCWDLEHGVHAKLCTVSCVTFRTAARSSLYLQ